MLYTVLILEIVDLIMYHYGSRKLSMSIQDQTQNWIRFGQLLKRLICFIWCTSLARSAKWIKSSRKIPSRRFNRTSRCINMIWNGVTSNCYLDNWWRGIPFSFCTSTFSWWSSLTVDCYNNGRPDWDHVAFLPTVLNNCHWYTYTKMFSLIQRNGSNKFRNPIQWMHKLY